MVGKKMSTVTAAQSSSLSLSSHQPLFHTGETNLKARNVVPSLLGAISATADLKSLQGFVEMEHPNNLIDTFSGVLYTKETAKFGVEEHSKSIIQPNNVLLRGCVLRSTWAIGPFIPSTLYMLYRSVYPLYPLYPYTCYRACGQHRT